MNYKNIPHNEPVAIVGIGCRFPGAKCPQEFWRLLIDGVDAITEVPASRFDINAFYDPAPGAAGKISSRFGGFIADIENFDAGFFGISPREAESMDPQQRLLIEIAYEALEDAGLPPDREGMSGTGVFLGMMSDDYLRQTYRSADLDLTMAVGGSRGTAAARISYALGFQGPSMAVDSDRASSLTALHLACQSLRAGECSVALVGACNLILSPELSIACSRSGILSSDGRCKFGDARADGIVRSEGCGVLVLKPLSHALQENDRVYAIVRGSAVTNNGSSSMELMRPSVQAQETLLRAALRDAGVCASDLLYVEAHGTGTRVGDKVEAEALGAVFAEDRPIARPCLIGSVKTNIGHAEAAGGMAGVIKVALALKHGLIPKSLHFQQENPELNLQERRLRVQTETAPWPLHDGRPAVAGVSAFGLTGTIAHVVLQAAPVETRCTSPSTDEPTAHLLPISARSAESLDSMVSSYRDCLEGPLAPESLARVCYSASVHRQHHPHRLGFVASSARELREQLDSYLKGSELHQLAQGHVVPGKTPKLAFIFPGQGGQGVGMGRELLLREPVFRRTVELCDEAVRSEIGWSVLELLRGEAPDSLLDEIDYLQPTLTAVMVALAALWRSWGIEPDATLGLSMGEAAAAHVAGMLDIPDIMAVVCRRARLLKRLRGKGAILSTPLTFAEAEKALIPYRPQLSIAVLASPTNTVLSGDPLAMKALADELESRGLPCRFVKSDVAGHSAQMDPLLDELRAELAALKPRKGSIPLASTVDDRYLTGPELDADYWARNLRQTVLQMNGTGRLLQDGYTTFLEVSPHPVAWNPLWETIRHFGAEARAIASLRRDEGERESLLKAAGALYAQGFSPNWAALFREEDKQFVPLPTYRWDAKPCWFKATQGERPVTAKTSASAVLSVPRPGARTRFLDQLKGLPSGQRRKFLLDHLQGMVGQILRLPDSSPLDCGAPLRQLGLTSLMATELALELERSLEYPCSATVAFNYPTIEKLTDHLLAEGVADSPATLEATSCVAAEADSGAEMPSGMRAIPEGLPAGQADQAELAEPIAIIGLACRFPGGAVNPEDYWRILRGGVDVITEVPSDRWNISDFYDANPEAPGKMYSRWGGFLDSIDLFDAGYFGISPREAVALDPQQRLLLEVTVEALENAGQAPDPQNTSNSGVFVGIMNNNDFVSVKKISSDLSRLNAHDSTGQATSAAAGRLSYALGFQGPSMAVDTACSSSLVAIHLACQSLRSKECRMAVAGGVNVILSPETTISFCKTRMLSPTGRCKTFDSRADGYVRGEGCGMIVLKRLSDAVRDKDNILALVRGSAVNQDGRSSSLTAPNGLAQQALLRQALSVAGIRPSEVDYIEAHGTGTALGDPIELEALGKVLGEGRDASHPFLVGSVKTNIGHLESAAGVAGLIKVILSLQNQEIPPHLHLQEVNPRISLNASNASIPTRLTPWARNGRPRVAGVSSFGFVGTNAHVVVEEAPEVHGGKAPGLRPVHRLLALSARSLEGLRELAGRYSRMLSRRSVDIDDLCYTANTGRVHHDVRAAITAASTDALREKLAKLSGDEAARMAASGISGGKIAFLFTGQGSQYQFMGRNLFAAEPVFRAALESCAGIIDPLLQRSLLSVINNEDPELLYQTQFAQPALFALEYAVFEQWRAWGVEPAMVMGHSLGEYTAAVAAQVLTLEQAAKLVVTRGRLMQSIQTPGGSAAIFAGEDFVRPFVEPYRDSVAIAADNAPERVLIAGEQKHLQMICDALKAKGVEVRSMVGLVGPHCPLMDPILDTFETIAAMAIYNPPAIPMVSTGTARVMTAADVSNPRHWRDLIRNKVRFREGMQVLHDAGCRIFLEIGPRHTLIRLGEMCLPLPDLTWLASLSKEKHDQEQMLESLGQLYTRGVRVDWAQRHRPFAGRKIALPTTVFEGRPFWPERSQQPVSTLTPAVPVLGSTDGRTQLLGQRLRSPLDEVQFEARIDLASLPMLEDHRILGTLLMPGAGHIVRVLAAAEQLTGRRRLELRDALFPEPLMLGDPANARVAHLVLTPKEDGYDFKISSVARDESDSGWRVHATGHVLAMEDENEDVGTALTPVIEEEVSKIGPSAEFSGQDFYAAQASSGYALGPTFRWLERVWVGPNDGLATLRMPRELEESTWRGLHPGLIDSCIQVASRVANVAPGVKDAGVLVPAGVSGFQLFSHGLEQALQGDLFCRISRLDPNEQDAPLKLSVCDQSGRLVFSIAKLHLRRLSSRDLLSSAPANFDESFRRIVWSDSSLMASSPSGQGKWLIFADEGGTGTALAERLRDRGQDAVMVLKAQEHIQNGHFLRLNAANQTEFNRQLTQMQADHGASWQGIVYLWGLDAIGNPATECLPDEATSHFLGLLNLVKAMINAADCPPVWVVTRGAQRTQRESKLGAIGQAMLWGMGRVFASEHSALLGGLVDLDPHAVHEEDAAQLLEELWAQDSDTQVAYRSGKRLVPRLSALGRGRSRSRFRARSDATYLITGAFGALGRKVAEWLVASGARHLALMSRRPLNDEASCWLQGLREQGVQVLPLQTDVAVMADLAEALARLDRTMPPLRGVMHAAGILDDSVFSKLEWPGFTRVQAPKAKGSWNLHILTADRSLDFWVIFSSVTALLGNPGQAAYVAGNAYADALVHHRRMEGLPALSINWGPWQGEGMSANVVDDLYRRWGLLAIGPSEGVEMLGQLLHVGGGQVWAAPVEIDLLRKRSAESPHLALVAEMVGAQEHPVSSPRKRAVAGAASRLQDMPDDQRRAAVLEHVVDMVRSVTGMEASEPVRVDARFETLGVDSLLTLDLLNALSRFFGVNLPSTIFINCPTVELLVKYLCEETAISSDTSASPAVLVS
ncbi:MAG TPA: type I polyketide synthase [Candidatus Angelobacter sp.]|nr:type I polyketide synthase [Candidatus Angelobacter sp.]